ALVLHPRPTAVATLVKAVGSRLASAAEAKSVTLELDYGNQDGVIVADPVQLDRALQNLLNNAVKFTPAGGRAALKVSRVGADVEFRVTDTGVGIPEEEQVRLFTRFFRSSVATRLAIQGTGLGLVIVKRIVEAHGGSVSIVSKPDVGTTVTVRLPADGASELEVGAA
ncbi:MAG: sensor histidine kinase, partial [Marmoricola sp.]